jgi:yecA family protein
MPTSDQYKLLRHGGVRTGAARAARGMSRSGRYAASADVLAPNLEQYGHRAFTDQDLQALAERLQDPKWPRETLNIYGLEGLLTALLVLPIGLRPGAWLPLIWKETGWKVPVALQGADQYHEFVEAVIGFMRTIDAGLLETPPRFASALDTLAKRYRPKTLNAHQDWARGFGLAVSQSNYLKILPDSITHRTLYVIAAHASPPSAALQHRDRTSPQTLQQAVLALADARTTRGALGTLPLMPKEMQIAPTPPKHP